MPVFNFDLLLRDPTTFLYYDNEQYQYTQLIVQIASVLTRLVPNDLFSDKIALFCAGVQWHMIEQHYDEPDSPLKIYMKKLKTMFEERYGAKSKYFGTDVNGVVERYQAFVSFAKRWPDKPTKAGVMENFNGSLTGFGNTRTGAMFLVGANLAMTKSKNSAYARCRRVEESLFEKGIRGRDHWLEGRAPPHPILNYPKLTPSRASPSHAIPGKMDHHMPSGLIVRHSLNVHTTLASGPHPPLSPPVHGLLETIEGRELISPLSYQESSSAGGQESLSGSLSLDNQSSYNRGSSASSTAGAQQGTTASAAATRASDCGSRQTAHQRHVKDAKKALYVQERKVAFHTAVVMAKAFEDSKLKSLGGVVDIVNSVNKMFDPKNELENVHVTVDEIVNGVKKGLIEPPNPRGWQGRLPDGAFEHLCDLFFSLCSISQFNCEESLTVPSLIMILERIIKPYFKSKNQECMCPRTLFIRIKSENSYRQDIDKADPRQQLRLLRFTVERLEKHYRNTEEFLVEHGFARNASLDELNTDPNLRIRWKEGQPARGLNGDESFFGLDETSNNKVGRKAVSLINMTLKNAGFASQHSTIRMTFFMAANFADEPLPPVLILPTAGDFKRINCELISRMHQIQATYGHKSPKRFTPMIACSPKGSMTAKILLSYVMYLTQLYPDVEDVPGKRLFIKLDNAIGRNDDSLLFVARQFGVYIYPACPNTSEGTQEMDQSFGLCKTIMEDNRKIIAEVRIGEGATGAAVLDIPYILFGGKYPLSDGSQLDLRNVFEEAFIPEYLKSSREKCGYCPANRKGLEHPKCRREIGVDLEKGRFDVVPLNNTALISNMNKFYNDLLLRGDDGTDAYTQLLRRLQTMNEHSCSELEKLGFANAILAKKVITQQIEDDTGASTRTTSTFPSGSRKRQDAMQKARFPGEFFNITSGGAANNCDDMLIAFARKKLELKASKLKKRKKKMQQREEIVEKAQNIMNERGGPKKKEDYQYCLMWKIGQEAKPKGYVNELKALWEKHQHDEPPHKNPWTEKLEHSLLKAERGEINDYRDSAQFKYASAVKCTYIRDQALLLDQSKRAEIIAAIYESMHTEEQRSSCLCLLNSIENGDKVGYTCYDYDSDMEDAEDMDDDLSSFDGSYMGVEDDKEGEESSIDELGDFTKCASSELCRCPWIPIASSPHTCFVCHEKVHSFCLGETQDLGVDKCALCVDPNRVCDSARGMEPPSRPAPQIDALEAAIEVIYKETDSNSSCEDDGNQINDCNKFVVSSSPDTDQEFAEEINETSLNLQAPSGCEDSVGAADDGESTEALILRWSSMDFEKLKAECKKYDIKEDKRITRREKLIAILGKHVLKINS